MAKVKKGDKIRRIKTDEGTEKPNFIAGYEGVVDRVYEGIVWDVDGCCHTARNIELVNDSPIRTVTRREIVPGKYLDGGLEIFDDGSVIIRDWTAVPLLRSAARIFNDIADVLDEQQEAA